MANLRRRDDAFDNAQSVEAQAPLIIVGMIMSLNLNILASVSNQRKTVASAGAFGISWMKRPPERKRRRESRFIDASTVAPRRTQRFLPRESQLFTDAKTKTLCSRPSASAEEHNLTRTRCVIGSGALWTRASCKRSRLFDGGVQSFHGALCTAWSGDVKL